MAEPPVPESPSPKPAVVSQDLQRLGPFRIERRIGAGGMGAVYLVRREGSKQQLALKVLPREKAKNPTLVKRFQAEAQAAAQIRHPNVVEVVDSGEADGYLYIAMEYVDGTDLHDFVRKRGPIPVRRTIEIVKQVASALQHAYEQNIVHRDIKPSNLLLRRDGQVKLSDFGLARSVDEASESNITRAGTTVGTVDFMSPEQARNSKAADVRSDLYSLGCAWYHMLTGHAPFPDGGLTNKLQAHAIQAPPDPRTENPAVTDGLVAILHRLMAKKPDDRYQTPKELLNELEAPGLTRQGVERNILSAVLEDLPSDQQIVLDDDEEDIGDLDFDTREELASDQKPKSTKAQRIIRRRRDDSDEEDVAEVEDESDAPEVISRRARKKPSKNKPFRPESIEAVDSDVIEEIEEDEAAEATPTKRRRKRPAAEDESDENHDDEGRKPNKAASRKGAATAEEESKDKPKKKDKRRKLSDVPDKPRSSLNFEPIRNVALLILGLLVVVGLGSLAAGFASRYFGGEQRTLQQLGESNEPIGPATMSGATINGEGASEKTAEPDGDTAADPAMTKDSSTARHEDRQPVRDPLADPDWLKLSSASNAKVIRVGRHQPAPSLAAGIEQAKGTEVLELVGSGVFFLPTLELENRRLRMRPADANDHPVVVWRPSARGATALTLRSGLIEMTGLHLVIDLSAQAAEGETNDSPTRFAVVEDGQFLMRKCSLTCVGDNPQAVTGVAVVQPSKNVLQSNFQQQVGFDRCIFRGNRLTPVSLGTSTADVSFYQCLSVSNEGPLAAIAPISASQSASNSGKSQPGLVLRVLNSTAWGNRAIVRLEASEEPLPAPVTVVLRDSLVATASPDQARLIAGTWPSQGGSVEQGRLRDFRLHVRDSAILGLTNLVDLAGQSTPVSDAGGLARFFGANARSVEHLVDPWQMVQADSWEKLNVATFDPATLPPLVTRTREGRLPGSLIADLEWPNELSTRRLAAMGQRPDPPPASVPPRSGSPLAVDLNKQDLGLMIERDKLPDDTIIVATGSGRCQISPFRVAGRSLRIRFEQGSGPPLSLVPKTIGRGRLQWIMLAEQGSLHLEGAALQLDQAANRAGFQTIFSVIDSQLRLDSCRLLDTNPNPADEAVLVDWTGTTNGAALTIFQSSLQGSGIALRAAGSRGQIALDNVLLAGSRAAFQIAPQAADGGCAIDVDWNHVTAATNGPAVDFRLPTGDVDWNRKLRMFVENSAFLASSTAGEKSDQSRVATAVPPQNAAKCVDWWGRSNGFSSSLGAWFQGEATSSPPRELWAALWGPDAEARLLSTPDGLAVAGATIRGEADDPARFELLPGCRGASWADGGTPVGILPGQLAANPTIKPVQSAAPAQKPGAPAAKSKVPSF